MNEIKNTAHPVTVLAKGLKLKETELNLKKCLVTGRYLHKIEYRHPPKHTHTQTTQLVLHLPLPLFSAEM